MALDDRMLRDIGLSRSKIRSAVRHGQQDHWSGARTKGDDGTPRIVREGADDGWLYANVRDLSIDFGE
jgi:hypothetical protein